MARGVRDAVSIHDRRLEEAAYYDMFASAYGWTETQVDDTRASLLESLPIIMEIKAEIRAEAES